MITRAGSHAGLLAGSFAESLAGLHAASLGTDGASRRNRWRRLDPI